MIKKLKKLFDNINDFDDTNNNDSSVEGDKNNSENDDSADNILSEKLSCDENNKFGNYFFVNDENCYKLVKEESENFIDLFIEAHINDNTTYGNRDKKKKRKFIYLNPKRHIIR